MFGCYSNYYILIKSPKRSGESFCSVSSNYIILLPFLPLFLSIQILSCQVIGNHWTDGSEIWGYDRYESEVVQEGFKVQNVGL